MNTEYVSAHITNVQKRLLRAELKVREIMQRQQERIERNGRFLAGLRD